MNLNKVFILGRLTRDPEQRTMPNGRPVSNFGMATNRIWTDQESREKQEHVEFHNIVAFGKLAEICNQYLTKGQLVLIEGRIQTRSWTDQDGNKRSRTEIVAENMQMGPRAAGKGTSEEIPAAAESVEEIPVEEIDGKSEEKKPRRPKGSESQPKASGKDNAEDEEINVKDIPF